MRDDRDELDEFIDKLKQERDELRVHIHLAQAELKQDWEQIEEKWRRLEPKLRSAAGEAREASRDIGAALGVVGEEIAKAYRKIRERLD